MNRKQRRAAAKFGQTYDRAGRTAAAAIATPAAELFAIGVKHHQAGRSADAAGCYRSVLAVEPRHAEALHLLGILAHQAGTHELAVEFFRLAIKENRRNHLYWCNLGVALKEQGKLEEAVAAYRQAIELKPDLAEAYSNLGNALNDQGKLEEAVAAHRRAIAVKPDYAEAYSNLGNALNDLGKHEEAVAAHRQAISLKPDYAGAHSNLGNALKELGELEEAVAAHRQAIALKPDYVEAHCNLGTALADQGMLEEAVGAYRRAIVLEPDLPETHFNLGVTLYDQCKFDEALASYERAIALKADYAEAFNNRGNVLQDLNRMDEALASYDAAIALRPMFAEALSNRGDAFLKLKRVDDALASFDGAVAFAPDFALAHLNRSVALLLSGDYTRGWKEYEWRWQVEGKPRTDTPQWQGEDVSGTTIFLYAEQGYGDTIQFLRYAPLVAARGARVILEVPNALLRLARGLPGVAQAVAAAEPAPAADLNCPLLSLPRVFATTVATIPADVPYLTPDRAKAASWRQRLAPFLGARIGLVWAGSSPPPRPNADRIDRRRSMTLAHFANLADLPGASFVSLQKGPPASQTRTPPTGLHVHDFTDELKDFADTAALIAALDLVISVDTSVAHLAGALGKPVWLLNRFDTCWRWLLDRNDSPWYPTLRQFRQPTLGDWDSVMMALQTALGEFATCRLKHAIDHADSGADPALIRA
jgi:tetratricopeptide (TPR) repeat protein